MTAAWIAIPRPSWLRPLRGRGRLYGFPKFDRVFVAEYFGSLYFSVPQSVKIFARCQDFFRRKDSEVRRSVSPGIGLPGELFPPRHGRRTVGIIQPRSYTSRLITNFILPLASRRNQTAGTAWRPLQQA